MKTCFSSNCSWIMVGIMSMNIAIVCCYFWLLPSRNSSLQDAAAGRRYGELPLHEHELLGELANDDREEPKVPGWCEDGWRAS